jgi:hypothetical protein
MKKINLPAPFAALAVMAVSLLVISCSGRIATEQGQQCSEGLRVAYEELDFAKARGFSGTVAWSKAASLLSAASVQKEFEKYPNCLEKVTRARAYIKESQQ